MVGFEVVADRKTKEPSAEMALEIRNQLYKRGVMANNIGGMYGNVFKISPPLVITNEQIDFAMEAMEASIATVQEMFDDIVH
jgi:4-aminobutyrate aminotransferase-like enzyme